ncbi:MAG: PilZ domain-containing protein [Candidatus Omnitrophica bacterium]|nr:PilZ domain-containing protein [Candidatus Omnitrophota bacterium]MBU1923299.1 PilZ domain-containing protein [Candidatus Omnitrophota bacterium]
MQEHRRYVRYQVKQQGRLKLEQVSGEWPCQVKDISYKGARIALNAKLPDDAAVRINLWLSEGCSIDAEVWIAWHKVFNGVNHYGIYFDKIRDADKDKIYSFLNKYCYNEMKGKWWPDGSKPVEENKGRGNRGNVGSEGSMNKENQESKSKGIDDHRIFERFPVNLSARYLNLDTGKEGLANALDASAKGLGLTASEELKLHTALEIWLEMKENGESLYTRGEVVWTKKLNTNNYKLGVELEKADLMGISRVLRA